MYREKITDLHRHNSSAAAAHGRRRKSRRKEGRKAGRQAGGRAGFSACCHRHMYRAVRKNKWYKGEKGEKKNLYKGNTNDKFKQGGKIWDQRIVGRTVASIKPVSFVRLPNKETIGGNKKKPFFFSFQLYHNKLL